MLRILLFSVLLPLPATFAQEADSTITLPPVTVTASRLPASVVHAPIRTQLLDQSDILKSGSQTAAELLRQRAALYVRQYTGGLSTLSQRGGTASQTLMLLDGHRIASPQLGQLDLSLLPTIVLQSVEITSGAASALYGTDAVSGVVNLQTTSTDPHIMARVGAGAWDKRQAAGKATLRHGRLSGTLAAELDRFTGNFPYWNRALFPPRHSPREGGDQQKRSLFGSVTRVGSSDELRLTAWYQDAERGLPDINATIAAGERQWDKHIRIWTHAIRQWGWGNLRVSSLTQVGALRYVNPRVRIDNTGRTLISSLQATLVWAPIHQWRLGTGIEAGYGRADHPSLQHNSSERHFAAFVHATRRWGRLTLYPSVRLDRYVRPVTLSPVNPTIGINLRLIKNLYLKGSSAAAFRMPTFNDRFWLPGGNPDLRPERGWSHDAGLIWVRGGIQAELTTFSTHLREQIVWQPLPAGHWAPLNVSRVVTRGLEISVDLQKSLSTRMRAEGGAVWTHTSQRSDSFLRLIPRHEIKGHAHFRWRFVSTNFSATHTGSRAITPITESKPFFLLHGQMTVHAGPVSVGVRGENLLNVRYEFLPANPMPPRHLRLDLTLMFH